ncbi:GGDEF domain-containing protein [Piscinibacter sakaiensis]|uniref:GGDEF domain-containing protein n=1 Tax=Piscinibacter sakaiensis TaxID=1547922 RepID=UPI003729E9F2
MTEDLTVALPSPDVTVLRDAEQGQRPCLIFYSGSDAGRRHDLDPGRHLIGRCAEARIVFDQPGISRRHAELEVRPGEVLLRDLGSANRTRVNGEFVEAPRALRQGDLVQLANVVLRYHDGNSLDALLHDRIYRMATTDAGTGAFNRRYLQENLEREVARARRGRQPLSAIGFDLDHFKRVNDGHGHPAGDALLHDCVQRVQQALRGGDLLCRVGGEEFVALLPDTGLAAARALAASRPSPSTCAATPAATARGTRRPSRSASPSWSRAWPAARRCSRWSTTASTRPSTRGATAWWPTEVQPRKR